VGGGGGVGRAGTGVYGTGSRLEYLLVPLVFGLGGPLVAMVGTNIGAGQRERALRAAWTGAAIATGLAEVIGIAAAIAPRAWLLLFDADPAMLDVGSRYLRAVGPFFACSGLAWRCTSPRRAPATCCGRSWRIWRGWPSPGPAAGSPCTRRATCRTSSSC